MKKGIVVKVTDVKVEVFKWSTEPWRVGLNHLRAGGEGQLGVVTVETDEGVSGNAFLRSPEHTASSLIQYLKPIIMGADPQDIGSLWRRMWKMNRAAAIAGIGALDICLWDINGKVAGQPIHRLLGTCKEKVPVYSSTAFHETTEEYVEEALVFKDKGWLAHKIHPHGDPA